jgi:hypothetical protein
MCLHTELHGYKFNIQEFKIRFPRLAVLNEINDVFSHFTHQVLDYNNYLITLNISHLNLTGW